MSIDARAIAQALASLYTTTVDDGVTLPQPVEDEARRVIDACVEAGLLTEDETA